MGVCVAEEECLHVSAHTWGGQGLVLGIFPQDAAHLASCFLRQDLSQFRSLAA